MTTTDHCASCHPAESAVSSSPPLPRYEALSLYVQLQKKGLAPTMCEQDNKKCRVCYAEVPIISSRRNGRQPSSSGWMPFGNG